MFKSPIVYAYSPDSDKNLDENLSSILDHMRLVLDPQVSFRVTLEIEQAGLEMTTKEVTSLIAQAAEDAVQLEKSEFVPVAVDAQNKVLYQRREDAQS